MMYSTGFLYPPPHFSPSLSLYHTPPPILPFLIVRAISLFSLCAVYMMYYCAYRAPGCGVMGQHWTIRTGGLVSQKVALSGTA